MDELIAACMNYDGALSEYEDFTVSDEPVWILGNQYSTKTELSLLRDDILARLWISYRRNFLAIGESGLTSDKGWGCMLRCGQMVIAEALMRIHLGRSWKWSDGKMSKCYEKIVSLFDDVPNQPYSIHSISQCGIKQGKEIGEWYGPNTIAHVLKKLTPLDKWNDLCISVAMDNILIVDEMKQSCIDPNSKVWNPLVIFIPLRLGVTEINTIYLDGIKKCFKLPQSLGLIGGTPNHALYFIGYVGDEIVYLDPHTTQDYVDTNSCDDDEQCKELKVSKDETYHCTQSQKMHLSTLDPSLAVCFLCQSEEEFDNLCKRLRQDMSAESSSAPLFELYDTRPIYMQDGAVGGVDSVSDFDTFDSEDEEFELLEC